MPMHLGADDCKDITARSARHRGGEPAGSELDLVAHPAGFNVDHEPMVFQRYHKGELAVTRVRLDANLSMVVVLDRIAIWVREATEQ